MLDEFREKLEIFSQHITVQYLTKKFCIVILCMVHDLTKYKICHNFFDLFYWPDGFCLDTLVIIAFFAVCAWTFCDDYKIYEDLCLEGTEDEF